jgi:hypothetical protein
LMGGLAASLDRGWTTSLPGASVAGLGRLGVGRQECGAGFS